MHITNIPLVLTSLTFALPYFAAIETGNYYSAIPWGALTCTSTLVHITKQPYHIHGPGNCVPWLYVMDVFTLYAAVARALIDGWYGGAIGFFMSTTVIGYAACMFYIGDSMKRFVFDKRVDMAILSHATVHLLSSFGGVGVLYLRAFKNGL